MDCSVLSSVRGVAVAGSFVNPLFGESLASFVPAAFCTCTGCSRRQGSASLGDEV
jgi:hypothetical protein